MNNAPIFVTYRRLMAAVIFMMPLCISAQIAAKDDYAHVMMNASSQAIKVLSNDSDTLGLLRIDHIVLTNHGKATISPNRKEILFTPEKDFNGVALLNYTITDNLGHYSCALVTVHVSEPELPETQTVKLFTRPGENIIFTVPLDCEFVRAEPLATGQIDKLLGQNGVYIFRPFVENCLSANFVFRKEQNGLDKFYNVFIDFVGTTLPQLLKDDYVYLPLGGSKVVDLYANDTRSKPIREFKILSTSNPNYEVTPVATGRASISSRNNFKGSFSFDYEVTYFDDTKEMATVRTTVANFEPMADNFEVTAYNGIPYELKYNIPLENGGNNNNWTFMPRNGGITDAGGTVALNRKNEIVYTPPVDGESDHFEVEYCVAGTPCRIVNIYVNLQAPTSETCSTDCVFPGDANRDGIVDMWDLMAVGNYIGQYGASRTTTEASWTPQNGENWSQSLSSGVNIKNADLNGDGIISHLDTAVISANYGKINSIVAEKAPEDSRITLQIQTISNAAALGDMLEITVLVGNAGMPVVDTRGLSFSVGYDADLVLNNTITVDFLKSSWLSRSDAYLAMSKIVNRGRIEAGIARSQNRGVSGQGEVVKIRAAIIEDVAGFQVGDKPVMRFRINDVYMMDKQGRRVHIEGQEIAIPIKIVKKDEPIKEADLLMFPNPSSDFMSFYLNGVNNIESLRVVDMMGKEVSRQNNVKGKQATVYFDNMTPGMYIAEVMTEKGMIVKKMQVVK